MTGSQRTIGWILFALVIVAAYLASRPDHSRPEGHQGSYLGRTVDGQQAFAGQANALRERVQTQRF